MRTQHVAKVRFTRSFKCLVSTSGYPAQETVVGTYQVLGNVGGHLGGLRVTSHEDGTATLYLRTDEASYRYTGVPLDAIVTEPF